MAKDTLIAAMGHRARDRGQVPRRVDAERLPERKRAGFLTMPLRCLARLGTKLSLPPWATSHAAPTMPTLSQFVSRPCETTSPHRGPR